jgi:quinol-cytochrome oxidoreductase complex cytochrome b subunit
MSNESFSDFLLHLHPRTIPESSARLSFTWCLGGLAFWMLLIEAVTGALLMLYYVPVPGGAYYSIQKITHVVPYGFVIRNLHYWCGQIMVILVGLHMVRVFVTGSFAPPRRLNWIVGVALLAGTVVLDFTGYLIVWDDRSLWAWTVARNLAAIVPVIGVPSASLLFGPEQASNEVLVRLYAWHVIVLPVALGALTAWHFWQIRKNGGISTPL